MKKLLSLALLPIALFAQLGAGQTIPASGSPVQYVLTTTDPVAGAACSNFLQPTYNWTNGNQWGCVGGFTALIGQTSTSSEQINSSESLLAIRALLTSGSGATIAALTDSIGQGVGANSYASGWMYQVFGGLQQMYGWGGTGFTHAYGTGSGFPSTSAGAWTPVQGIGPSQTIVSTFGETQTGANGAIYAWTFPSTNDTIDMLYWNTASTTATACSVSVDFGSATVVGAPSTNPTPQILTLTGLNTSASSHTVRVTSDGTCNFGGFAGRKSSGGLNLWNFGKAGATTSAFSATNQLSMLSVIPNLGLVVVELGQNDPTGSLTQAQSVANLNTVFSYTQSLGVPVLVVLAEAPQIDAGQGALYKAEKTLASTYGYPWVSIYDNWGSWSAANALGLYYTGDGLNLHPSQKGHNLIADQILRWFGVGNPAMDVNSNTGFGTSQPSSQVTVNGTLTTITLPQPVAPKFSNGGVSGSTTYCYVVVAKQPDGSASAASPSACDTTGNATLSSSNYNGVFPQATALQNAVSFDVYRTSGGATTGKIGVAYPNTSLNDIGQTGDGTTAPTSSTSGNANIGGSISAVVGVKASGTVTTTGIMGAGTASPTSSMTVNGQLTMVTLATASAPTVGQSGTAGSTSYTYKVIAMAADGSHSPVSAGTTTATGNATLSGSNCNTLSWSSVSNAVTYGVYRTASSGTPSSTGKLAAVTTTSYTDCGTAGDSSTPSSVNNAGQITFNNTIFAGTDNAYDIGASGSGRVHEAYIGTAIASGTTSNTDWHGKVTLSSGSGSQTFSKTYGTAPDVWCKDNTTPANTVTCTASTTAITITGTGTDVIAYRADFYN